MHGLTGGDWKRAATSGNRASPRPSPFGLFGGGAPASGSLAWHGALALAYVPCQLRNYLGTFKPWKLWCGHWRTRAGG